MPSRLTGPRPRTEMNLEQNCLLGVRTKAAASSSSEALTCSLLHFQLRISPGRSLHNHLGFRIPWVLPFGHDF